MAVFTPVFWASFLDAFPQQSVPRVSIYHNVFSTCSPFISLRLAAVTRATHTFFTHLFNMAASVFRSLQDKFALPEQVSELSHRLSASCAGSDSLSH
jgi:hypothetical protein